MLLSKYRWVQWMNLLRGFTPARTRTQIHRGYHGLTRKQGLVRSGRSKPIRSHAINGKYVNISTSSPRGLLQCRALSTVNGFHPSERYIDMLRQSRYEKMMWQPLPRKNLKQENRAHDLPVSIDGALLSFQFRHALCPLQGVCLEGSLGEEILSRRENMLYCNMTTITWNIIRVKGRRAEV